MSRITSRLPIIPGSFEDRSIEGFCLRKTMSKSGFYRMPEEVRDKLVTVLGPRTLRIRPAAERHSIRLTPSRTPRNKDCSPN